MTNQLHTKRSTCFHISFIVESNSNNLKSVQTRSSISSSVASLIKANWIIFYIKKRSTKKKQHKQKKIQLKRTTDKTKIPVKYKMNLKLDTIFITIALIACQHVNGISRVAQQHTEDEHERSKRFVFLKTSGIGVSRKCLFMQSFSD